MSYYVVVAADPDPSSKGGVDLFGVYTQEDKALAVAEEAERRGNPLLNYFGGYWRLQVYEVEDLDALPVDVRECWDAQDEDDGLV